MAKRRTMRNGNTRGSAASGRRPQRDQAVLSARHLHVSHSAGGVESFTRIVHDYREAQKVSPKTMTRKFGV